MNGYDCPCCGSFIATSRLRRVNCPSCKATTEMQRGAYIAIDRMNRAALQKAGVA